ncbi:MAG: hypothetical protein MHM6MM_004050 [Cercozoa sp. M6MM]
MNCLRCHTALSATTALSCSQCCRSVCSRCVWLRASFADCRFDQEARMVVKLESECGFTRGNVYDLPPLQRVSLSWRCFKCRGPCSCAHCVSSRVHMLQYQQCQSQSQSRVSQLPVPLPQVSRSQVPVPLVPPPVQFLPKSVSSVQLAPPQSQPVQSQPVQSQPVQSQSVQSQPVQSQPQPVQSQLIQSRQVAVKVAAQAPRVSTAVPVMMASPRSVPQVRVAAAESPVTREKPSPSPPAATRVLGRKTAKRPLDDIAEEAGEELVDEEEEQTARRPLTRQARRRLQQQQKRAPARKKRRVAVTKRRMPQRRRTPNVAA